jgi:chaperonin cofactor prefoldin
MEHRREDDPSMQTVRELATHTADIKHIQADMNKMAKDIEEIKDALREISKTLAEAKGGWKMFLAVGGAGAAIASLIAWLNDTFKG